MGLSVDPESYQGLIDAVAVGTVSSGAVPGGGFGPMAPWADRPWAGAGERQMSEALKVAMVPSEKIRGIRPNLPVPPTEADVAYDRTPLTIEGALDEVRWSPTVRSWTSGSSRPVRRSELEQQTWEGTPRGSMMSVNPMG